MNEIDNVDIEILRNVLRENIVSVRFTKIDGTERTMTCTLSSTVIPSELAPKTNRSDEVAEESSTIAVFDIDKQAWRSFRKDSVIDWKIVS